MAREAKRRVAIRDDVMAGEDLLACSVCGFEYVHLRGVETRPSSDADPAGQWRQGATALVFECEEGHCFEIELGCHKGYIYLNVARRPQLLPGSDDAGD